MNMQGVMLIVQTILLAEFKTPILGFGFLVSMGCYLYIELKR